MTRFLAKEVESDIILPIGNPIFALRTYRGIIGIVHLLIFWTN